jgi:hypothetical protein
LKLSPREEEEAIESEVVKRVREEKRQNVVDELKYNVVMLLGGSEFDY